MIEHHLLFLLGLVCISNAGTFINKPDTTREDHAKNIVGVASHVVTNSLLQGHVDSTDNFVFSPLGFSSILAILNEGARGQTAKEIESVLNFGSASLDDIRSSYEGSLKHLSESNAQLSPQFKTWFYIYKNNTVEPEFRSVIEKYYSVDVKEIKRFDFDSDDDIGQGDSQDFNYPTADPTEGLEFTDETTKIEEFTENEDKTNFSNTLKKLKFAIVKAEEMNQKNNVLQDTESSKFDRNIEDKQYEEVDKIRKYMMEEKLKEKCDNENKNQLERESEDSKNEEIKEEKKNKDKKQKTTPIKKEKRSFIEDDVASALSGNSIVGKTKEQSEEEYESKMLLFNGLYFRGNWMLPFQELRASSSDIFYNSTSEKTQVTMMRTRGTFRTAFIKSIDVHAVEIPYENERYALLIVMPKIHNGLSSLIKQYNLNTLDQIEHELKEEHLHLALPKFKVETTGRAEKPLAKTGITSLFTRKADLSGISKEQKLHVDELVQHVAVRVDEGAISQNAFSATNAVRSETLDEELLIDHPFLFFVRDIVDDIIVVAGAINHVPANKPVTFFKKNDDRLNKKEE